MKVVAAYLLAHLGGKSNPSADDISKILSSGAYKMEFTAV
jgi:ribosomal protein L12E/L44/L45/RPP1/RPP2